MGEEGHATKDVENSQRNTLNALSASGNGVNTNMNEEHRVFRRRDTSRRGQRSWLYVLLNGRSKTVSSKRFRFFITVVILINVVSFVLSTVPQYEQKHEFSFWLVEAVSSVIFAVEYILRVITCTESRRYRNNRCSYLTTFRAIIDLLSFLPFLVEEAAGYEIPTTSWIRVFRLFRILKTEKYMSVSTSLNPKPET